MARKQLVKKPKEGAPGWMTTFADLMSLLLTFFILLYSFSNLDAAKFHNISVALQSALLGSSTQEIFDTPPQSEDPIDLPVLSPDALEIETEIQEMYAQLKAFIEEQNLEAELSIRTDRRGVVIDIQESVLFDLGSAEIKPGSKSILDKLYLLFERIDKDIAIEGHTDNLPIHTQQFDTNWELSAIRAINVLRYFIESNDIDPRKISASGYGEHRPVASNETSEGRSKNRRVNILLLVNSRVDV